MTGLQYYCYLFLEQHYTLPDGKHNKNSSALRLLLFVFFTPLINRRHPAQPVPAVPIVFDPREIFPLVPSLALFVCTVICSGAVSLARSLQVSATSPEGGATYFSFIFPSPFLFDLFLCFLFFSFFCFLLSSLVYRMWLSCLSYSVWWHEHCVIS